MKLTKSSKICLIAFIYIFTLYLGINAYTSNNVLINIKKLICYLIPAVITLKIIFENFKNIKELFKNKLIIILYFLIILWFILTGFFGIKFGYDVVKGIAHYGILMTLMLVLFNLQIDEKEKNEIKRHVFISLGISIALGIMQYIFKFHLNTGSNTKYIGINGRINATFSIATLYDKYICLLVPFILYEISTNKEHKNTYKILLVLTMLGVTLTFSRTGQVIYLALLISFIILNIIKKNIYNILLSIVIIISMVLIPGAKYSIQSGLEYVYEEFHIPKAIQINLTKHSKVVIEEAGQCINDDCVDDIDGSEFFRKYYKKIGKEFIKEYPIFGVGVNNYTYLYNHQNAAKYLDNNKILSNSYPYMFPHCGFIQIAAEIGYIGLILLSFYLLIFGIVKFMKKINLDNIYLYSSFIVTFILCNITENIYTAFQVVYLVVILYQLYNITTIKITKKNKKIKE